ncbi:lactoferrin/transferrin family TonB-dependent receptor [Moraxella sp. ZY200743]|uniref:lactoferrin/transferrin family TonB-dependent receptor n=1 Tax=Moraxella sp. ZY200743 TaxID=2911970 RepID=UPI003D7E54D1
MKTVNCRLTHLSLAVCAVLFGGITPAIADDDKKNEHTNVNVNTPNIVLDEIAAVIKKRPTKRSEEVTGLGKTVKTAEEISEKQILSIRDLVRDTPGVAVVEQGRGASSGYTVRGMDKNRVAVTVDGLNQAQSYLVQKRQDDDGREGSGAINEIELENVSAVQISQGASGTESGSGALGGAVSFRTKSVDDVLDGDQKFTTFYKGAYANRDKQIMHSVGAAFRSDKVDALVQYTDRTKDSVQPHKDILKTRYRVWRWASTPEDFKNGGIEFDKYKFVIAEECADYQNNIDGCQAKPTVSSKPVSEDMSAKNYTGKSRVMGDPMDYESGSYLAKFGYNITDGQRLEAIYENTKQQYDTRDMTKEAYHLVDHPNLKGGPLNASANSKKVYTGQNYHEGFVKADFIGAQYAQARFINERHNKTRWGLDYQLKGGDVLGVFDKANISFDRQSVNIDNFAITKACSVYPNVDKDCKPSPDKPNSSESTNRTTYNELHNLIRANFAKSWHGEKITHNIQGGVGFDKFKSTRGISDLHTRRYLQNFKFLADKKNKDGEFIQVWSADKPTLDHLDICRDMPERLGEARKCGDSVITGYNAYASLKDTIHFGERTDLSIGLRHDKHKFNTDDDWTGTGKYSNTSWNVGLAFRPTDRIELLYRISSGYRVPSFKELFGYRLDGQTKEQTKTPPFDRIFRHEVTNVRPEKALNQEIGAVFGGNLGNLEVSYFDNRYEDLIDLTLKSFPGATPLLPSNNIWAYRNYQDVHLNGFTLGGKLYFDALSDKLPSGLTGRLAYLRTNVKSNKLKDVFVNADGYFLDTITPTRYVLGLDYAADSDKWGMGATWTFTGAKNEDELKTKAFVPSGESYERRATNARSGKWQTLDLSAFYRPNQYITVRGSIQNALNHRYSTWESLRQTSITSGNAHEQGSFNQYAAPGRNFVVSLEMKY